MQPKRTHCSGIYITCERIVFCAKMDTGSLSKDAAKKGKGNFTSRRSSRKAVMTENQIYRDSANEFSSFRRCKL